MPGQFTVGELKRTLAEQHAKWSVNPRLHDNATIRPRSTGGSPEGLQLAKQTPKLNLREILNTVPANPFIVERRRALNLLPDTTVEVRRPMGTVIMHPGEAPVPVPPPPIGGTGRPVSLDWRNRWGWPWITTVQDQDPCESCWAFAATALVESMARIEHAVWSKRSEGDVHDGMGAKCANLGNSAAALDWIKLNGICDPDCYPYRTDDPPYNPTPDRNGRTVKIYDYTFVGDIEQQKVWLDSVGPLVTWFDVYQDFFGYHTGVYHKLNSPTNTEAGGHYMLVVGYDDNQSCWIVKNSWGTGYGQNGYYLIGYGESSIDQYAKIGLSHTNPDPWTKRRLHAGNIIESGNGALHRNFEMLSTASGSQIHHWWRDNSVAGFPWHSGPGFGNDAAVCPTLIATTFNRNFESVHLTNNSRLHHYFFDQAAVQWVDGGVFGPTDAAGVPGFIQSIYGTPGNFEVVVRTKDGKLNHWWRINHGPWTWSDGGRFGDHVAFSGPALLQNRNNNLEVVCVLDSGQMQRFWRDDAHGMVWHAGEIFGTGISGPPCMIEGQYGCTDEHHIGNYELCVAAGGQVQHWWKDNFNNTGWHKSAAFASNVAAVAGLLESSYGFNLELIVLRTDGQLQHYWRDGAGWHAGPVIGSTLAAAIAA